MKWIDIHQRIEQEDDKARGLFLDGPGRGEATRGGHVLIGASGRLTTVDFAHCRRLPCRDRAYRSIVPSSATRTAGPSTDKISHHTSMRAP